MFIQWKWLNIRIAGFEEFKLALFPFPSPETYSKLEKKKISSCTTTDAEKLAHSSQWMRKWGWHSLQKAPFPEIVTVGHVWQLLWNSPIYSACPYLAWLGVCSTGKALSPRCLQKTFSRNFLAPQLSQSVITTRAKGILSQDLKENPGTSSPLGICKKSSIFLECCWAHTYSSFTHYSTILEPVLIRNNEIADSNFTHYTTIPVPRMYFKWTMWT